MVSKIQKEKQKLMLMLATYTTFPDPFQQSFVSWSDVKPATCWFEHNLSGSFDQNPLVRLIFFLMSWINFSMDPPDDVVGLGWYGWCGWCGWCGCGSEWCWWENLFGS